MTMTTWLRIVKAPTLTTSFYRQASKAETDIIILMALFLM